MQAWRPWQRALLLGLVLSGTAFAGCLGTAPPPHDEPTPAPGEDSPPAPIKPLPQVTLEGGAKANHATFHIVLDGDASAVAWHTLVFGDESTPQQGEGAPPPELTHTYPPIAKGAPPRVYVATLTLLDAAGRDEVATVHVDVTPVPPDPPRPRLITQETEGSTPLIVHFRLNHTDPPAAIRSWGFEAGDGSAVLQGNGAPPAELRHEYRTIGTHHATLRLTGTSGLQNTTRLPIQVLPPQGLRLWALTDDRTKLEALHANGTPLPPSDAIACAPACGKIVAMHAHQGTLAILHDGGSGNGGGILRLLDARSGEELGTMRVSRGPDAIHIDPAGGMWVSHQGAPHITRIHLDTREAHPYALPLADEARLLPVWDRGARVAWILAEGSPARLYRLDTETGTSSVTVLPHIHDAIALARSERHGTLHLATTRGTVHTFVEASEHAVPVRTTGPATIPADPQMPPPRTTAIACPSASDHCWASSVEADGTASLFSIAARPPTSGSHLPEPPASIPLPDGAIPTRIMPHHDMLLLTFRSNDGRTGLALADPSARNVTMHHAAGEAAPASADPGLTIHPQRDRLIHFTAPSSGTWAIFDLDAGDWVHENHLGRPADLLAVANTR